LKVAAVQRPQHSNMSVHQRPATFRRHDQGLGRGLLFLEVLFGLRQLHDVAVSIFERDELAPARRRDRILERPLPAATHLDDENRVCTGHDHAA
jgi:hypothetical protein